MDSTDLYDEHDARAARRGAAQAGRGAGAHAVRAGPRPGRARRGVAAAGREDPGASGRRATTSSATGSPTASRSPRSPATCPGRSARQPDIAETAALAHDLGHPPFGHNGERALAELARACGGFEGNAQTLRLLTRLEAKTFVRDGGSVGLNLTRATLDACTKYPWPRDRRRSRRRKFGVYADDLPVFDWLRAGAPDGPAPVRRGAGHGPRRRRRLLRPRRRGRRGRRSGSTSPRSTARRSGTPCARGTCPTPTDDALDAALARLREVEQLARRAVRRVAAQPGRAEEPHQRPDRPVLRGGAGGDVRGGRGAVRALPPPTCVVPGRDPRSRWRCSRASRPTT